MDDEDHSINPSSAAVSTSSRGFAARGRTAGWPVPPRTRHDYDSNQDSSDDSLGRRRIQRRPVIDLAKRRQDLNPDADNQPINPHIIWNAKVYQSHGGSRGSDLHLHKPDLTYVDNRPIEFPISVPYTQRLLDTEGDVTEPTEWTDPIMAIEVFIEADFETDRISEIVASGRLDQFNLKNVSRRHLVVRSPFLIEGLSGLVQYYPSFYRMLLGTSKVRVLIFQEPFPVLLHHFDAIEAMANNTVTTTTSKSEHEHDAYSTNQMKVHMQHLIEFLRPIYTECVLPCQKYLAESVPRIAFNMIWYLLKPGTDVYVQYHGSTYAAVVIEVWRSDVPSSKGWGGDNEGLWLVDLWRLETDGTRMRRGFISVKMYAYTGLREVKLLSICPVSIYDAQDGGEQRGQILRRSATFFKALSQGNLLADYNGPVNDSDQYVRRRYIKERSASY